MADSCAIHDEEQCKVNQLCVWDPDMSLCVDYASPTTSMTKEQQRQSMGPNTPCNDPMRVNTISKQRACEVYVHQPAVVLSVDSESQSMFYHW